MTQSGCCPEQATSWLSWQRANGVIVALALLVLGLLPGCAKMPSRDTCRLASCPAKE